MSLYFIAVIPHEELSNKIRYIQKDFADRFQSSKAYRNFPHITIIPPFAHDEKNESEVVGHFFKTELDVSPFEIQLNNFECFPNKKNPVIFIEPQNKNELKQLYKKFDATMNIFKYISNFNPHLTVAYRDLTFENFEKAWEEYQNKTFEENFLVERVILYKHFNGKWNELASKDLKK